MLLFANRFVMKTFHTAKLTGFAFLMVSLSAGYSSAFATQINQDGREGIASVGSLREVERLEKAGDLPAAIEACRRFLVREPHNEKAALALAELYRRVHNEDDARRVLANARRDHPLSVAVLTAGGSLEIEAQAFDTAIEQLEAALKIEPRNVNVRNQLAGAYLRKGDSSLALQEVNEVLTEDAGNGLALFMRASIFADADENEKAFTDIKLVLDARPQYLPARILYAKLLVRTKECEKAANVLHPAGRPPDLDGDGLFLLANAYDCAGKKELANGVRAQFEAASRAEHEQAENRVQSLHLVEGANELAMRNHFDEAMELLRQALEKNPQNAFAYSQQAKIYFSMKEESKAREALAKARQIQPYQPDFLFVQGVIEAADGNLDAAQRSFEEVTLVNPQEADAYFEIGKLWIRRNNRQRALEAFRKAAELSPDDSDYRQAVQELSGAAQ
jgi:Flp pilus assembly protein TadD